MSLTSTDLIGYIAMSLTTAAFAPQALHTLKTRDVSGISLAMYLSFTVGVALWLVYGLLRSDWPIIIGNVDRVRVIEGSRARWDAQAGRILGADAVLEVKTASAFAAQDKDSWGEPGTDQVP